MYRGRPDDAIEQATLAMEIDPRSPFLRSSLARHYQLMRQFERAAEQYRIALSLDPAFLSGAIGLALAELQMDQPRACLERVSALAAARCRPRWRLLNRLGR